MKQTSAVVRLALGHAWAYRILQKILVRSNTRQSVIGRYVQPRARDRIVDIGCGPADILEHRPDVHYFGIDINPDYVRVARDRYGARANFIEGGLETLRDIPATSADIVMALALLHPLMMARRTNYFAKREEFWRRVAASLHSIALRLQIRTQYPAFLSLTIRENIHVRQMGIVRWPHRFSVTSANTTAMTCCVCLMITCS
jgi:SAM-dependent methyltransferase